MSTVLSTTIIAVTVAVCATVAVCCHVIGSGDFIGLVGGFGGGAGVVHTFAAGSAGRTGGP